MLAGVVAFDRETDFRRLDYHLMMRGPVRLVHSRTLLNTTVEWLRQHDYEVVLVDASWLIVSHMFRDLGSALGYTCHDQWHCLRDGLGEALVETWSRSAGFALVLTGFDVFERHQRDDAYALLELVVHQAWPAALLGQRLICLVQSDKRSLSLRRIGMPTLPWVDNDPDSVVARS
ncbi:hypothetical protein [Amycolatopsis sp. NPDC051128]|uniref:hypothetical protein n=1 Tax=Amycolatopsis sp. NPDC051128 TaxID=3155412 RepID=UPI0034155A5D